MKNASLDVAALGELLIDFTHKETDADGYPTMAAHPGGAPANFLAALSAYGMRTALLGKVGDDAFGRLLLDSLDRCGIDRTGVITDSGVFTTLAFVTLDAKGDRSFSFARKPGADTCLRPDELRLGLIDAARVLHFGTLSLTDEPSRSATREAVRYARAAGKLISFDPNLRPLLWPDLERARTQMLWGLEQADVVKISDEELRFLFGPDLQAGAQHILEEYQPALVFVTCGAEGCYFRTAQVQGKVPALSGISVADTTGAGDIFGGSALYGVLRSGKEPGALSTEELTGITAFACAAAGLSTKKPGGISSVPSLSEVEAAVKQIPTGL